MTTKDVSFKSAFDFGYVFSGASEKLSKLAASAPSIIRGFPNDVDKNDKKDACAGSHLRYQELHPAVKYAKTEADIYIPINGDSHKASEVVSITVAYALSFSEHQIHKLRVDQPNLHALVMPVRSGAKDYGKAFWSNLVKAFHGLKERKRGVTKDWMTRAGDVLGALKKSMKTARTRGDTTAPSDEKFAKADAAFWAALK